MAEGPELHAAPTPPPANPPEGAFRLEDGPTGSRRPPAPPRRPAKTGSRLVGVALAACAVGVAGYVGYRQLGGRSTQSGIVDGELTHRVTRGDLRVSFTERGEIKASKSVEILSELEGRSTIVSVVAEGGYVEKDQVLVELDSSELQQQVNQQQISVETADSALLQAQKQVDIQKSLNDSSVDQARLDVELARIDLEKYTGEKLSHDAGPQDVAGAPEAHGPAVWNPIPLLLGDEALLADATDRTRDEIARALQNAARIVEAEQARGVLAPDAPPSAPGPRAPYVPAIPAAGAGAGDEPGLAPAAGSGPGGATPSPTPTPDSQASSPPPASPGGGSGAGAASPAALVPVAIGSPAGGAPEPAASGAATPDAPAGAGSAGPASNDASTGTPVAASPTPAAPTAASPTPASPTAASPTPAAPPPSTVAVPTASVRPVDGAPAGSAPPPSGSVPDGLDPGKRLRTGDFLLAYKKAIADVKIASAEVARAKNQWEWTARLAEKGYVTGTELTADTLSLQKAELSKQQAQGSLELFLTYTWRKDYAKFRSAVEQAEAALIRAEQKASAQLAQVEADLQAKESTAGLSKKRLEKLKDQLSKTKIRAPQSGMVVYVQERRWGRETMIEPGAEVTERQLLMRLPDVSTMAVEVDVHESWVDQVREGTLAFVSIDALPNLKLRGKVTKIGILPDNVDRWLNPDLKVYQTDVTLDDGPDIKLLRPGMSAKVEVVTAILRDVVYVPVQSVTSIDRNQVCYVLEGGRFVPRTVQGGRHNESHIEIVSGLSEGEVIQLNAPPPKGGALEPRPEDAEAFEVEGMAGGPPGAGPGDRGQRGGPFGAGGPGAGSQGRPGMPGAGFPATPGGGLEGRPAVTGAGGEGRGPQGGGERGPRGPRGEGGRSPDGKTRGPRPGREAGAGLGAGAGGFPGAAAPGGGLPGGGGIPRGTMAAPPPAAGGGSDASVLPASAAAAPGAVVPAIPPARAPGTGAPPTAGSRPVGTSS